MLHFSSCTPTDHFSHPLGVSISYQVTASLNDKDKTLCKAYMELHNLAPLLSFTAITVQLNLTGLLSHTINFQSALPLLILC